MQIISIMVVSFFYKKSNSVHPPLCHPPTLNSIMSILRLASGIASLPTQQSDTFTQDLLFDIEEQNVLKPLFAPYKIVHANDKFLSNNNKGHCTQLCGTPHWDLNNTVKFLSYYFTPQFDSRGSNFCLDLEF